MIRTLIGHINNTREKVVVTTGTRHDACPTKKLEA